MNQSRRTVPVIANHEERQDDKMLWSILSNAAERSKRQDTIFLRAYGIDEVVMDIQNSRLIRVVLTVCRLVRI